jgi:hypothetical protein
VFQHQNQSARDFYVHSSIAPCDCFFNRSTDLFPGTDVMIFKIFSPKNSAKTWRFDSQQS